ncbi:hypothetical protein ABW20_dc0100643 [Dactylellina cionopaga]|nr:hypothetical protein ABW20_dc0100643 [Dactylellina cionopaga]
MLRRATATVVKSGRRHFSTQNFRYQVAAELQRTPQAALPFSKGAQAYDKNFKDEKLPDAPVPLAVRAAYLSPLKVEATYNVPSCDLQIRSFTLKNVEFFADFALRAAFYLKLPAFGPIPLPRRTERWTVLKGNFVHKKAQQNFERVTYKRLIQIKDGHPDVVQIWLAFLRKHEYHGIGMKANVYTFEKPGAGSYMSEEMTKIKELAAQGKTDHNKQLSAMHQAFDKGHRLPDPPKVASASFETQIRRAEKSLILAETNLASLKTGTKETQMRGSASRPEQKAINKKLFELQTKLTAAKKNVQDIRTEMGAEFGELKELVNAKRKAFGQKVLELQTKLSSTHKLNKGIAIELGTEKSPAEKGGRPFYQTGFSKFKCQISPTTELLQKLKKRERDIYTIIQNINSVRSELNDQYGKGWAWRVRMYGRITPDPQFRKGKLYEAEQRVWESLASIKDWWQEMDEEFGERWAVRLAPEHRSTERLWKQRRLSEIPKEIKGQILTGAADIEPTKSKEKSLQEGASETSSRDPTIDTTAKAEEDYAHSLRTPEPTGSESIVAADSSLVPPPTQDATKEDFRNAKEIQVDEVVKKD